MSVFSPINVQAPIDRRKQLLSKLMGQYQSSHQASAQMQAQQGHGSFAAPAAAGGHPFRSATSMPQLPHAQVTQQDDVNPMIAKMLGPGGHGNPLPFERSGGFGQALNAPTMANLDQSSAPILPTLPVNAGTPGVPGAGVGAPSAAAPSGAPSAQPNAGNSPGPNPNASFLGGGTPQAADAIWSALDPAGQAAFLGAGGGAFLSSPQAAPAAAAPSPDAPIHLGNGLYYDPTTDSIRGGGPYNYAGGAARGLR